MIPENGGQRIDLCRDRRNRRIRLHCALTPAPELPLQSILRLSAILVAMLLTACSTNPYSLPKIETGEPSYEEQGGPSPPQAIPDTTPDTATAANNTLLARAEAASAEGDYDRALAYLERAQRIDPDVAGVYLALAQTHAAAGNASQARAVAERGLLYCQGSVQCDSLRGLMR